MLGREHVFGHPALTDEVTGLANRLHFELVFRYLFHGARRGVPLTVMMVAVDGGSDDDLTAVGVVLQGMTRTSDLVAHLERGLFAVLLLGTNLSGGRVVADRVEESLGEVMETPVSVGLAARDPETMDDPSQLYDAVEQALGAARGRGGGLEMV